MKYDCLLVRTIGGRWDYILSQISDYTVSESSLENQAEAGFLLKHVYPASSALFFLGFLFLLLSFALLLVSPESTSSLHHLHNDPCRINTLCI